jgi:hypothetical protein
MTMESDRDRDERRRETSRRSAEQEGARVQRQLSDLVRATEVAALRARDEADRLGRDAGRRTRSAQLSALLDTMLAGRSELVARIDAEDVVQRSDWSLRLSVLNLADRAVDAELAKLREEVERERAMWAFLAADAQPSPRPSSQPPHLRSPLESVLGRRFDAVGSAHERRREQRAMDARLRAGSLALVLSSLDLLIARRRHYEVLRAR